MMSLSQARDCRLPAFIAKREHSLHEPGNGRNNLMSRHDKCQRRSEPVD